MRSPWVILALLLMLLIGGEVGLRLANPRAKRLKNVQTQPHGKSRELFVVMHSWNGSPQKLHDVVETIERTHPDADLIVPSYPSGVFSNADPWALSYGLDEAIQHAVDLRAAREGGGYDRIVLVGHSAGALLLRKAYVFARGAREDAPGGGLESAMPARTWPDLVTRFVLLAGINRGWTMIPRPVDRPLLVHAAIRAFDLFTRVTGVGGFIMDMERGSPFVANLRIQWIRLFQTTGVPMPSVYQLLGDEDAVAAPEDSQDFVKMTAFQTIPVLGARHGDIIRFAGSDGEYRRQRFEEALLLDELDLAKAYAPADTTRVTPEPPASPETPAGAAPGHPTTTTMRVLGPSTAARLAAGAPPNANTLLAKALSPEAKSILLTSRLRPAEFSVQTRNSAIRAAELLRARYTLPQRVSADVDTARKWNAQARLAAQPRKRVVFILHGIRDNGDFANHVRDLIVARTGENPDSIDIITDKYDRFALLPFLFYGSRQKHVRWFMDLYTEALARSPGAAFSFIGHSNGTYVLASALQTYKTVTMGNVVFAGSVVPRRFDWNGLVALPHPRVANLLNVRAAGDVVVAVFPRFYELIYRFFPLGWFRDIGSAGYGGFEQTFGNRHEIAYVRGGHGAALDEPNVEQLVDFALDGHYDAKRFVTQPKPDVWVDCLSGVCGLVWLAIVGILVGIAILISRIPSLGLRVGGAFVYLIVLLFVFFNV